MRHTKIRQICWFQRLRPLLRDYRLTMQRFTKLSSATLTRTAPALLFFGSIIKVSLYSNHTQSLSALWCSLTPAGDDVMTNVSHTNTRSLTSIKNVFSARSLSMLDKVCLDCQRWCVPNLVLYSDGIDHWATSLLKQDCLAKSKIFEFFWKPPHDSPSHPKIQNKTYIYFWSFQTQKQWFVVLL